MALHRHVSIYKSGLEVDTFSFIFDSQHIHSIIHNHVIHPLSFSLLTEPHTSDRRVTHWQPWADTTCHRAQPEAYMCIARPRARHPGHRGCGFRNPTRWLCLLELVNGLDWMGLG